jgi:hypothetical protein
MTETTIFCSVCKAANPRDARFCFKCGSPLAHSITPPTSTQSTAPLSFLTLTCPACGGSLKVNPQEGQALCSQCGTTHLVVSGGGMVTLRAVQKVHAQVQQIARTTQQINQGLSGAGQNLNQQSSAYMQNAQVMSLTQELIATRKDLKKQQDVLNTNPTYMTWALAVMGFVFFFILPAFDGAESFTTAGRIIGSMLIVVGIPFGIFNHKVHKKAKMRIPELEKRLHEIEDAIRASGGSVGNW